MIMDNHRWLRTDRLHFLAAEVPEIDEEADVLAVKMGKLPALFDLNQSACAALRELNPARLVA
jgi:hypothetical protein